jgi:hypothetical protein
MFFIFFHFAPSNARVREGALGMTAKPMQAAMLLNDDSGNRDF